MGLHDFELALRRVVLLDLHNLAEQLAASSIPQIVGGKRFGSAVESSVDISGVFIEEVFVVVGDGTDGKVMENNCHNQ